MDNQTASSILIVDDNARNLQVLAEMLGAENYKVALTREGQKAIKFAIRRQPDLILLDIMMPVMDGFEVCSHLKSADETRDIPVIFISALTETEDKVRGFAAGGVDYVTKPFQKEEVLARVKTHLELKRSREALRNAYEQLREAYRELEIAARTDTLTRLSNRRDMMEKLRYEKDRSDRGGKLFSLILTDIDNFKSYNDRFGHDFGDQVLKTVADVIRSRIRRQDTVARWGGEEFLLLLPETNLEGGRVLAENVRRALAETVITCPDQPIRVSMTYGVSLFKSGMSLDACIKLADEALYAGKHAGKDCVMLSAPCGAAVDLEWEK